MFFSERYGYRPVREIMQIDSVDEPLRNGLWNLLQVYAWDDAKPSRGMYGGYYLSNHGNEGLRQLCHALWFSYFKKPLDQLDNNWTETRTTFDDTFSSVSGMSYMISLNS